ncbi:OOP family OmpA-OmpF porin [Silvimonas terrae]|uniref:OOP family OmpA-OmpF porin n=1 Tax=Silvimonas terrae TaxID=300266 RepID=A0A840RIV8_9NEIS|nr:OmpA family protein [Silvimonas terrae]MBB5192153.1 OOP family OmpA-OmpF porin [Silvimonas terrae]
MKQNVMALAIVGALASAHAMSADDFTGFYVGGKTGVNLSRGSGGDFDTTQEATATVGVEAGYNAEVAKDIIMGVDAFYDYNNKTDHDLKQYPGYSDKFGSQVYGADLKLGMQFDRWMPYAKVGYAWAKGTGEENGKADGMHAGLGVEYKLTPNLGLTGEWTASRARDDDGAKLTNNNFTVGLNYYFGARNEAPLVMPAVVAPVIPKPEPKPEAKPVVVAPKCNDVTTSTPVRIDGASFANASSKLKADAYSKLDTIVAGAKANPDVRFEVAGFTDSRGSAKLNSKLSTNRALAVKQYLVAHGIDANRIISNGYGPEQPVADNASEAGRAQNRRVEIRFTKNETSQRCN